MIPEFAIREWSEHVPWTESEQVEQDLLICRALTEIYKDEYLASHLAFRGGTALHKLFLSPQPRYSEDIDLVQINAEPIKETYDHIRDALAFLGEPKVKQKKHNNTLIFRLESESIPVVPIHLKVEINCKEHFSVLPMQRMPFSVVNKWYNGKCDVLTYQLDELVGTKLRALYQRRKGRDLYDLYKTTCWLAIRSIWNLWLTTFLLTKNLLSIWKTKCRMMSSWVIPCSCFGRMRCSIRRKAMRWYERSC